MKLLGAAVSMAIGCWLMYWTKRRQFNRTNSSGSEVFKNYRGKVIATATEKIAWNTGVTLVILGALLVA